MKAPPPFGDGHHLPAVHGLTHGAQPSPSAAAAARIRAAPPFDTSLAGEEPDQLDTPPGAVLVRPRGPQGVGRAEPEGGRGNEKRLEKGVSRAVITVPERGNNVMIAF